MSDKAVITAKLTQSTNPNGNEQQKSIRNAALRETGSIGYRPQESRQSAAGGKGEAGFR